LQEYTNKLHANGHIDNVKAAHKDWGKHYRERIEELSKDIEEIKQLIERRGY